jgi:hypothetical protein
MSRTLLAGWFSFEGMGATAGDLMARDLCSRWMTGVGIEHDIALVDPFVGGVDWRSVDPADYAQVVFVCGPFGNGRPITEFLERFAGRRLVGLDLTMLQDLDEWNPFDVLIERDSSRASRPDISFLADEAKVPLVGVVLVHRQAEYRDAMHDQADAAIERLLASRDVAQVAIDTRLDVNSTGLSTSRQVESLIAGMDAIVTTRLHGTVLAIKNGVPPLVIDPIAGGRKVLRQAQTIGWSRVYIADELDDQALAEALDYCLSAEGRTAAANVRDDAVKSADLARVEFIEAMASAVDKEAD